MTDPHRSVRLDRLSKGRYRATNAQGDTLMVSEGGDGAFTPVELLLVAMAGCTAIDVDYIVGKRAEPVSCRVTAEGDKVRDDDGNHMDNFKITFDVTFESTDAGRAADDVLPRAIAQSNDRICTVSRTVQLGATVQSETGAVPE